MKTKICFIGGGLAGGGQERALVNLANYYAVQGLDVTILNLFKTDVFFDIHPDINIIWPALNRATTGKFSYAIQLLPFIRKQVKIVKPDVIISFGEWFNAYVILATRFLSIPLFVTNRMGPNLRLGKLLDNANKILYRYADGVIAQTERAKEIISKRTGVKKITVIPNAVQPINVVPVAKKNQIVTVGRLSREKGHANLIKAFAKIKNTVWTLHIVGDGKERAALENLAKELEIYERVVFYGHRKEFSDILAESDIFVLPSYYEGFPNALLEAMSIPLASISSNCVAGPADIITHNANGLLYETEDIESLTRLLDELIEDKEKRDRLATEAYKVRKDFDFETLANRYLNVLTGKTS